MNRLHRWYCSSGHWRRTLQESLLPWAVGGVDFGDHLLEVGPGPGLCSDWLSPRAERITAVEIDPVMAASLARRFADSNVTVIKADATDIPVDDGVFTSAVCLTMLHHVPSAEFQDRLLAEVCRVLRPGGILAGCDSTLSLAFRLAHTFDTMTIVDPDSFERRLGRAGFADIAVKSGRGAFRFRAIRPSRTTAVV